MLDEVHRWDRELSQEEQTAVALARMVVQAPHWVLMDGTLSALPDDLLERVSDTFEHELRYTAIVHIGPVGQTADPLFRRVVHLVKISGEVPSHTGEMKALTPPETPHEA